MSEEAAEYGVSYIASAPEELKVGDRVMVIQGAWKGKSGTITLVPGNGMYRVGFGGACYDFLVSSLAKVCNQHPTPITFDEPFAFELGDMVEIVDKDDDFYLEKAEVVGVCKDKSVTIRFPDHLLHNYNANQLRKVPNPITFSDVDPVIFENDSPSEKFRKIAEEMCNTYERKNATYGNSYSDGFRRFGATQLVSRIYEKYCRVENLLCHNAENKVPDESVKDTLTDMSVMCICLRMLIEDNDFENVE